MGGNVTKIESYEKVESLISISQPRLIDEVIKLEVGEDQFWIRVKEMGLSETGEGGRSLKVESGAGKEDDTVSESESVARTGPEIAPKGRSNGKKETLISNSIEKEIAIMECQQKLESEIFSANQSAGCREAEFGGASGLEK